MSPATSPPSTSSIPLPCLRSAGRRRRPRAPGHALLEPLRRRQPPSQSRRTTTAMPPNMGLGFVLTQLNSRVLVSKVATSGSAVSGVVSPVEVSYQAMWWHPLPVTTVLGLEEGKDCVLVGILFKNMKLKPSILDEYSKERSAIPLVMPHNFMYPNDNIVLEDECGRVALCRSHASSSSYDCLWRHYL